MTLAELLMSEGKLARQRPDQKLAPDWREKLLAMGAGAVDPLSIPSAVTGTFSPETRDAWRATQAAHPGMAAAGGMASALPAMGAVSAVPTTIGKMLAAGGLGAGSDVIDEAAGIEGSIGKGTAIKALASQIGVAPAKALIPAAGGLAASQVQFVPSAEAQEAGAGPLTEAQRARQKQLQELVSKRSANATERRDLAKLDKQEADAAAIDAGFKRTADEEARKQENAVAEEERRRNVEKQSAAEMETKGRVDTAQKKYDETLGAFPKALRETKVKLPSWLPFVGDSEIDVGGTLSNIAPIIPVVAAGMTGAKLGKTADGVKMKAWNDAVDTLSNPAATATQRAAADAVASRMSADMAGRTGPKLGEAAARTAAATGLGAVEGGVSANLMEVADLIRLDKNPQRVALEEKLKLLPPDTKEYEQTRALLADKERIPDKHPDWIRAQHHFTGGDWIPRTALEASTGAATGGLAAYGRQMLPFVKTPSSVIAAKETGARAATPEAVAQQAKAMDEVAATELGSRTSAAMRGAEEKAATDFYSGPKYRDEITGGLEAKQAARLSAAEVERRGLAAQRPTGAPEAAPGQSSGTSQMRADLEPVPGSASNQSVPSSAPVVNAAEQTAIPASGQAVTFNDLSSLIKQAMETKPLTPLAPLATARQLPPPNPGPGRWADEIQPVARDVIKARLEAGGTLGKGSAAQIGRDINAALPDAVKRPSPADVRERVKNLRDIKDVGDTPSTAKVNEIFDSAPTSIYRGKKIPAIAAIGASGAASTLSPDAQADVRRSVANSYMAGTDLTRIKAADVQGNNDPQAVEAYLGTLREKVGKLPTRGDQLRALKSADVFDDPTSPTGKRHVSGRFVAGGQ